MHVKTILIQEYVNFVDVTKTQNIDFKINIYSFVVIFCFFFVLFKHLNE